MKIGIIGANGQVGKELTIALDTLDDSITCVPIVRNQLSRTFFDLKNFNVRTGDVTEQKEAEKVLADINTVVIAGRAKTSSTTSHRQAHLTNKNIVKSAVQYSNNNATIIFFSSIRAFGSDLYRSVSQRNGWNDYRIEKLECEQVLKKHCKKQNKKYYALRLGLVFGEYQRFTKNIINELQGKDKVHVSVKPEWESNVLHMLTLGEVLLRCSSKRRSESGIYTVVN